VENKRAGKTEKLQGATTGARVRNFYPARFGGDFRLLRMLAKAANKRYHALQKASERIQP
jgi:hypothetical protein